MSIKTKLQYWGVCIVMMLAVGSVNAQCNPLLEQDTTGSESPIFCNLDSLSCLEYTMYYDATFVASVQFDGPACAGTVENSTWLSFIAWDTLVNLDITYSSCAFTPEWPSPSVNLGIQVFLFNSDTLWNYTPLTYNCDCGEAYTPDVPINLVSDSLIIGNQYYLMIDGCAGNVCDVQIEVQNLPPSNSLELPELQSSNVQFLNASCGTDCLCPGTTIEISLLDHENIDNVDYDIVIIDDFGSISMQSDTSAFMFNPINSGEYTLQVEFSNTCDDSNDIFETTFVVASKDTITYPSDTLCAEDIQNFLNWPLHWTTEGCVFAPMIGDSLYECTFIDSCFCVQVEQKRVVVLPPTEQPVFDTTLCSYNLSVDLPLTYMNYIFEEEAPDGIVINTPMGTENGCDSSIFVRVYAPFAEGDVEILNCDGANVTYLATLGAYSDYLDPGLISFDWIVNGSVMSNGNVFSTSMDSLVTLVINWEYDGVECSEIIAQDTSYLENSEADFELPEVECRTSMDTVFFDFEFLPSGTSTVMINQTSAFANYWDDDTWIFPGITTTDIVSIQLTSGSNFCTGSEATYTCSTECSFYTMTFPQDGSERCIDDTPPVIPLQVLTFPMMVPTLAQQTWMDGDGMIIGGNFQPVMGVDSVYTFYYEINDNGCKSIDSMSISIFQDPYLEMLQEEIFICQGTLINFDTIFNYVGSGSWEFSGIMPMIDVVSDQQDEYIFTPQNLGLTTLYLTGSSSQCNVQEFGILNINVERLDTLTVGCFDSGFPIQLFWDEIPCHTSYDIYVNSEFIKNQTGSTYTPIEFPPGTTLEVEIVPISECLCPYDPGTITCNTGECPIRPTELEWRDTTFCQSELPAFVFNTVSMNNGVLSESEQFATSPDLGTSMYFIDIEYDQLCTYRDSFSITVVDSPTLELFPIHPTCYTDSLGSLSASYNSQEFASECLIDGELMPMTSIETMSFGIGLHEIEAESIDGCIVTETVVIDPPTDFQINLSGSDSILEGSDGTYVLQTTLSSWSQIDWFYDGNLICENSTQCIIESMEENMDSLALVVVVYAEEDCFKSDTLNILVEELPEQLEDVFVSNIFNPNFNGNETWLIGGNTAFEVQRATVFDRWGTVVYDKQDFIVMDQMSLWDGTFNGTVCQQGVYIYVLEYTDTSGKPHLIQGDITLLR